MSAAAAPNSPSGSFDSNNSDDAQHFLWEWRAAQDRYSKATLENDQLEIHLGASQVTLLIAEEEANAAQARLAKSNAMVLGKMNSKKTLIPISIVLVLIALLFL